MEWYLLGFGVTLLGLLAAMAFCGFIYWLSLRDWTLTLFMIVLGVGTVAFLTCFFADVLRTAHS